MPTATKVKTPQERLDESIASANKDRDERIARARVRFKYETSDAEECVKLFRRMERQGKQKMISSLFNSADKKKRIDIARILMGKAKVVRYFIQAGSYLYFGSRAPRLGNEHFNIILYLPLDLSIRHEVDFSSRPSEETVLTVAKSYFPSVKRIDTNQKETVA